MLYNARVFEQRKYYLINLSKYQCKGVHSRHIYIDNVGRLYWAVCQKCKTGVYGKECAVEACKFILVLWVTWLASLDGVHTFH